MFIYLLFVLRKKLKRKKIKQIYFAEGSDAAVGLLTDSQYIGCMKNMRIDFFPVNLNTVISAHGDITSNACPL